MSKEIDILFQRFNQGDAMVAPRIISLMSRHGLIKKGKGWTKETEAVDRMIQSFEDNQDVDAKSKILMRKICRELYVPVTYRSEKSRIYPVNRISYYNVMDSHINRRSSESDII